MTKYLLLFKMLCLPAFAIQLVIPIQKLTSSEKEQLSKILQDFEYPTQQAFMDDGLGQGPDEILLAKHEILFSDKPRAETDYIVSQLGNIGQKVTLIWVPQTIWDLYAITEILKDKFIDLTKIDERIMASQNLLKILKNLNLINNNAFSVNNKTNQLKKLFSDILDIFSRAKENNNLGFIDEGFVDKILEEKKDLDSDKSLLIDATLLENEAQKNNHILLWRATSGAPLNEQIVFTLILFNTFTFQLI